MKFSKRLSFIFVSSVILYGCQPVQPETKLAEPLQEQAFKVHGNFASLRPSSVHFDIMRGTQIGNYVSNLQCRRRGSNLQWQRGRMWNEGRVRLDKLQPQAIIADELSQVGYDIIPFRDKMHKPEYELTADIKRISMEICEGYEALTGERTDQQTGVAEMIINWHIKSADTGKTLYGAQTVSSHNLQTPTHNGETELIRQAMIDAVVQIARDEAFYNILNKEGLIDAAKPTSTARRIVPDTSKQQLIVKTQEKVAAAEKAKREAEAKLQEKQKQLEELRKQKMSAKDAQSAVKNKLSKLQEAKETELQNRKELEQVKAEAKAEVERLIAAEKRKINIEKEELKAAKEKAEQKYNQAKAKLEHVQNAQADTVKSKEMEIAALKEKLSVMEEANKKLEKNVESIKKDIEKQAADNYAKMKAAEKAARRSKPQPPNAATQPTSGKTAPRASLSKIVPPNIPEAIKTERRKALAWDTEAKSSKNPPPAADNVTITEAASSSLEIPEIQKPESNKEFVQTLKNTVAAPLPNNIEIKEDKYAPPTGHIGDNDKIASISNVPMRKEFEPPATKEAVRADLDSYYPITIGSATKFRGTIYNNLPRIKNGIVTIMSGEQSQYGFFVSPTYIITNKSYIDSETNIDVQLPHGQVVPGKVLRKHPSLDIAMIEIDHFGYIPLPVSYDAPAVYDDVYSVGYPYNSESKTFLRNKLSAFESKVVSASLQGVTANMDIAGGNSHSPLFSSSGNIIAVPDLNSVDGGNVTYIPIQDALESIAIRVRH